MKIVRRTLLLFSYHKVVARCWANAGPPSKTSAQHWPYTGPMPHVTVHLSRLLFHSIGLSVPLVSLHSILTWLKDLTHLTRDCSTHWVAFEWAMWTSCGLDWLGNQWELLGGIIMADNGSLLIAAGVGDVCHVTFVTSHRESRADDVTGAGTGVRNASGARANTLWRN